MATTVLGIFTDRNNAEEAIDDLTIAGYNPKDLSIIMRDRREREEVANDRGADVAGGVVSGVTAGAILGGLAGLLASTIIPGLGAFFVGGPIAAALGLTGVVATTATGAATGALAGGLLGALTGLGLSEEEATAYEERINEGGILLAVPARAGEEVEVEQMLSENGADDVRSIALVDEDEADRRDRTMYFDRSEDYASSPQSYAGAKGGRASTSRRNQRR